MGKMTASNGAIQKGTPMFIMRELPDGNSRLSCDDCDAAVVIEVVERSDRLYMPTFEQDTVGWSVTKRRQRCPACSTVARAKGWIR